MRKAIFALVVVFAVTAVASAVHDSAAGGTIYFGGGGAPRAAGALPYGQYYYYVDVTADWTVHDDDADGNGAELYIHIPTLYNESETNDSALAYTADYGAPETWIGADMGGQYHNADLVVPAYTNDTLCPNSLSVAPAADLVSVNANDATPVGILNDGWGGNTVTAPTTYGTTWTIPVDSNFTPNGEARGIVNNTGNARLTKPGWTGYIYGSNTVWVDTDDHASSGSPDGFYDEGLVPGNPPGLSDGMEDKGVAYSAADPQFTTAFDGTDNVAVTGMVISTYDGTNLIKATYKKASGGYISAISTRCTSAAWYPVGGNSNTVRTAHVTAGDTDGNGVPDVYIHGGFDDDSSLWHLQDLNGDGDWLDANEGVLVGGGASMGDNYSVARDIELVDCGDGKWNLLKYANGSDWANAWEELYIFGLNSDGNWDGTSKKIILYSTVTNTAVGSGFTGDQSFGDMLYTRDITFAPLGAGEVVPEPATMLLVGTGVLSLVGVIRRRFLH